MQSSVACLLVVHDGARWLPTVLEGLRTQRVRPDHLVAVDTGSRDGSADLVATDFPDVLRVPGATTFPAAVEQGLAHLAELADSPEWVWILHDDSTPDPGALAALLAAAEAHPEADVLGPKLREWPSLRRLLEIGVTITGTGRRETGLERAELDQGQHDEVRQVLAVNTAGMLVRRRVLLELGGFDRQLPIFGNDIDFGWRAAAAGRTTLVVPQAVVFHAEAAHRGVRRTSLTGRHTHYQERRAALYTLLVNASGRSLPFQVVRLALGTLLRMGGLLLVRAVGPALDELAALLSLYSSPREIGRARRDRRERRALSPGEAHDVRSLLAPRWLPYRRGLDVVGDLASALTLQASDVAERRRAVAAEHDPASFAARRTAATTDDDDALIDEDTGLFARFITNPVAVGLALVVVLAVIGARSAFGHISGGGLSPAPAGASEWWGLLIQSRHPLGVGTQVPAPAYLFPLALLASVLGGHAGAALGVVFVLGLPIALGGAWRFLRVTGRLISPRGAPRWILLWAATTYALVPVVSGAWGDGRIGVVVAGALLPWLAHAALGFADPDADRRRRAGWRTGLLLAVLTAFTPALWPVALLVAVLVIGAALVLVPGAIRDRSSWGPPVVALGVPVLLLLPWWLPSLQHHAAAGLLLDSGRLPVATATPLQLLGGRLGDLGAAPWLGLVLPALALLALFPRSSRIPVLVCWLVALVAGVVAAVLGTFTLDLAALATAPSGGVLLVLLQGAFAVAATLGAQGALVVAPRGVRRVAVVVVGLVAAVVPLGGLGWFVAGAGDQLSGSVDTGIPAYMVQSAATGPSHGILVVRGSVADGLTYTILRGSGTTLGEDEVLALTPEDTGFTQQVQDLVARPTESVVDSLAQRGIEYVVLPSPADPDVAAALDATGGLVQASAEDRSTRAWQVGAQVDDPALTPSTDALRVVLLVLAGVGLLLVLVLCAPTRHSVQRTTEVDG